MIMWIKRHKVMFIVEILCVLLLFPGCFAREKKVIDRKEISVTGIVRTDFDSMKPGVYRLRAAATTMEDLFVLLNLGAEHENYMTLRYNEGRVTREIFEAEVTIYVVGEVENPYIEYTPSGWGNNLLSVELVRLNWGSRILFSIAVMMICFINYMVVLREKIVSDKVSKEQVFVGGILVMTIMLVFLPYGVDYISLAGELGAYLDAIELYSEDILLGIQNAPILVVAALFRWIGFPVGSAYKLYLFMVLAVTASVTYLVFREFVSDIMKNDTEESALNGFGEKRFAAAFGSVAFMASPYYVNLVFKKQAVAEYTAMIFWVLLLGGLCCLIAQMRRHKKMNQSTGMLIAGLAGLGLCYFSTAVSGEAVENGSVLMREIGGGILHTMFALAASVMAARLWKGDTAEEKATVRKAVLVGMFIVAFLVLTLNTNEIAITNSVVRLYDK